MRATSIYILNHKAIRHTHHMRMPPSFVTPSSSTFRATCLCRLLCSRSRTLSHPSSRMTQAYNTASSPQDAQQVSPTTLYQMRHSRTLIRECWRTAINRTNIRTVIDATAGRGSDSISLGHLVGRGGTVHALDILSEAVEETSLRYEAEARKVGAEMGELRLACSSHASFAFLKMAERSVSCIVYNLGWYPGKGADRTIVTLESSTVASLRAATELVAVNGIISVTAYVGHNGGREEEEAVVRWASQLPNKSWNVINVTYPNREQAPRVLICERVG